MKRLLIVLMLVSSFFITGCNNDQKINKNEEQKQEKIIGDKYQITYTEEEYNKGIIQNKRNIVSIESDFLGDSDKKIEKYLRDISDEHWKNVVIDMTDRTYSEELDDYEYTMGLTYMFKDVYETDNVISFISEQKGHYGGVSWDEYLGYNFDKETGEELTLDGIGTDLKEIIKNECRNQLLNLSITEGYEYMNFEEGLKKTIEEENVNWYFTEKGIHIVFQRYRIGAGALGIIELDIDKALLNDNLLDKYKI